MAHCTICRQEKEGMTKCKECGQYFCENCGNKKRGYCDDCLEYAATEDKLEEEDKTEAKVEASDVDHEVEEMEQEEDH
jgi:hypothetical protein